MQMQMKQIETHLISAAIGSALAELSRADSEKPLKDPEFMHKC